MKEITFITGVPGSGKSTLAQKMMIKFNKKAVLYDEPFSKLDLSTKNNLTNDLSDVLCDIKKNIESQELNNFIVCTQSEKSLIEYKLNEIGLNSVKKSFINCTNNKGTFRTHNVKI
ncbi:hypothetical protein IBE33_09305 [Francisella philomiragia]|uniref:hypothetical protein n=1 Tax=Francisella philomiragia TaxID=28110 RepID=UPI001902CF63|nr:hypothetical protein [Francisella philomiragia]MBK2341706.1 hypothetical protein [Francisella philomiragia]